MKKWKLTPVDLLDPRWNYWDPTPIKICAASESDARRSVEASTATLVPTQQYNTIPINPWSQGSSTTCEEVVD